MTHPLNNRPQFPLNPYSIHTKLGPFAYGYELKSPRDGYLILHHAEANEMYQIKGKVCVLVRGYLIVDGVLLIGLNDPRVEKIRSSSNRLLA